MEKERLPSLGVLCDSDGEIPGFFFTAKLLLLVEKLIVSVRMKRRQDEVGEPFPPHTPVLGVSRTDILLHSNSSPHY